MRVRQGLYFIHQWTGLLTGLNILVVSVTGAYLVFAGDLERAFGPPPGPVLITVDMGGAHPLQDMLDGVAALHPGSQPGGMYRPRHTTSIWEVGFWSAQGASPRYVLDEQTGTVREKVTGSIRSVYLWMLRLHGDLFLGGQGFTVMGVVAMLFLLSVVTGLLIYGQYMKAALFGLLRPDRGTRRLSADLHLLIGAGSLGFNLLIAITGIAITFGLIVVRDWEVAVIGAQLAADPAVAETGAPLPPIDTVLQNAEAAWNGLPVSSVVYPGSMQGPANFLCLHGYPDAVTQKVPKMTLVPCAAPERTTAIAVPWWITVVSIGVPLHFGDFAGFGMKLAFFVFGLTSGVLSITGAVMTLTRWGTRWRRRRKSHADRAVQPEGQSS